MFLCTKWENLAFVVEEVNLFIDEAAEGESPPKTNFRHFGCEREQRLIWKTETHEWMRLNVPPFREFLHGFLLQMLFATTIDPWDELKNELDTWHKEKSFERALASSPTSVELIDLLGKHSYDLNNWINSATAPQV